MSCFRLLPALVVLASLSGCIGKQPQPDFFLLEPLAVARAGGGEGLGSRVIGVGPIRFPRYLNRPQVIVAQPGGKFVLQENQRWAEDLGDNFARVFTEDLAARLPSDRVLLHPWPRTQDVDFKVTMRVNEFHLTETGIAKLDARWELYGKEGLLSAKKSLYRVPVGEGGEVTGAMALSRTVDMLSKEAARAIDRFRHAIR